MADARLPTLLRMTASADAVTYFSPWLKASLQLDRPTMSFLCLDASGHRRLQRNLLKAPRGADLGAAGWGDAASSADASFTVSRQGNMVRYQGIRLGDFETVDLTFTVHPKGLSAAVDRSVPRGYLAAEASPLRMLFDARHSAQPDGPAGSARGAGLPGSVALPGLWIIARAGHRR